jgi:Flp pilus assembly protein TadB
MSDTPLPTPQPNEENNQQTHETTNTTNTQHKKDTFSSTVDDVFKAISDAFKKINERQLVLRNRAGQNVLRLPLVWAIVIVLVSFAIQVVPILVIAVIVALVTKHQFVLEHNGKKPYL